MRNVAKGLSSRFSKAYTHNGWFKSLDSLVHFYNTRRVKTPCEDPSINIVDATEAEALANNCWPAPEFGGVAPTFGSNGLTTAQEAAIVAYLKTLSDVFTPRRP